VTSKETKLPEVIILGYDDIILLGGIISNGRISLSAEFDFFDVGCTGKSVLQARHESMAQVLVE
jgi:hypothetical protein